MSEQDLTAWGRWVRKQPRGTMVRAQLTTGLAYSTIHYALRRRVTMEVAEALAKFTGGAVKPASIARRRKPTGARAQAA